MEWERLIEPGQASTIGQPQRPPLADLPVQTPCRRSAISLKLFKNYPISPIKTLNNHLKAHYHSIPRPVQKTPHTFSFPGPVHNQRHLTHPTARVPLHPG